MHVQGRIRSLDGRRGCHTLGRPDTILTKQKVPVEAGRLHVVVVRAVQRASATGNALPVTID
jgi:hypothetical protein